MSSIDKPPLQSDEIVKLAAWLRVLAAAETDPTAAQSLLASAERFEKIDASMLEALAGMNESIENTQAVINKLQRNDQLPWWFVLLVLAGVLYFLYVMATRTPP